MAKKPSNKTFKSEMEVIIEMNHMIHGYKINDYVFPNSGVKFSLIDIDDKDRTNNKFLVSLELSQYSETPSVNYRGV